MNDLSRRSFLAGLGASIVAVKAPSLLVDRPPRSLTLVAPSYEGWTPTFARLASTITSLSEQITAFGALTREEADSLASQVDVIVDNDRPIRVLIDVEASLEHIARGEFEVREIGIGHVSIKERAS